MDKEEFARRTKLVIRVTSKVVSEKVQKEAFEMGFYWGEAEREDVLAIAGAIFLCPHTRLLTHLDGNLGEIKDYVESKNAHGFTYVLAKNSHDISKKIKSINELSETRYIKMKLTE